MKQLLADIKDYRRFWKRVGVFTDNYDCIVANLEAQSTPASRLNLARMLK